MTWVLRGFCVLMIASVGAGVHAETSELTRYEVLLDSDGPSPDVLYNLGTAYAEKEQLGRSIWMLERARLAAPHDGDVLHNLEVVRQRVRLRRVKRRTAGQLTDGEPEGVSTYRTVTAVDPAFIAWPTLFVWTLAFGLLMARRRVTAGGWRDAISVAVVVAFVVAGLGIAALAARSHTLGDVKVGVVLEREPSLRQAPIDSDPARSHADLYEGATVRVLSEREDGWVRIALADGSMGWMNTDDVGRLD